MPGWDERYRSGENLDTEPSPLLERFAAALPPGRALDLACGAGRNALYLASLGWQVTAVDSSRAAIEILKSRAGDLPGLAAIEAELEDGSFVIEPGGFDLVCDFFFLERSLFPQIRAGIRAGGLFVATIHMFDELPDARPRNPAFLLRPGELRSEFAGWERLHDEERRDPGRRRKVAELVARRRS